MAPTVQLIRNPYSVRRETPAWVHEMPRPVEAPMFGAPNERSQNPLMGRNSHHRTSSIRRNQKNATKRKAHKHTPPSTKHRFIQLAVNNLEEEAFDRWKHCRICVAKKNKKAIKRAHHVRCERNKTTKGQSEATVNCEKETRRLARLFGTRMSNPEKEREVSGTGTPSIATAFSVMKMGSGLEPGTDPKSIVITDREGKLQPRRFYSQDDIALFLERGALE